MRIDVTCALIESGERVLVAQRAGKGANNGLWEFPGGKVAPGEGESECLVREIREELGVSVRVERRLRPSLHQEEERIIRLIPFVCSLMRGTPQALEHERIRWALAQELLQLDWCPADIAVLRQYLRDRAPELLDRPGQVGE